VKRGKSNKEERVLKHVYRTGAHISAFLLLSSKDIILECLTVVTSISHRQSFQLGEQQLQSISTESQNRYCAGVKRKQLVGYNTNRRA
jgi:hypothetical protein